LIFSFEILVVALDESDIWRYVDICGIFRICLKKENKIVINTQLLVLFLSF